MKIIVTIQRVDLKEIDDKEYKKIADSGNKNDGGAVYAYVDKGLVVKREYIEIYKQEAEVDSIRPVVAAINNLTESVVIPGCEVAKGRL